MKLTLLRSCSFWQAWFCRGSGHRPAKEPNPPAGFRAIFNGKDLTGWYGLNPHSGAKLTGEKKEANLKQQRAEFPKHWRVENGELVNDGTGPYATTEAEFGDIEFRIEYKTVAKADSGIYLRGTPQVQIWDWNQVFDPKNPTRKPHLGSGGLFNNTPGAPGRDPLVLADKPFGEWNQFRIRQIGARTWVWLNEKLVVDGAVMENYWDRSKPLPAKGPIMLQTHGGEIRWRNLFVHEIGAEEAKKILDAAESEAKAKLSKALTLHASFDKGLDADFSRGDKKCYVQQGKMLVPAKPNEEVKLAADAGRFGGALHFPKKGTYSSLVQGRRGARLQRQKLERQRLRLAASESGQGSGAGLLRSDSDHRRRQQEGLHLPGMVQGRNAEILPLRHPPALPHLEPEQRSMGGHPLRKAPDGAGRRAPFSREKWTHVVFTLENINDKSKPPVGKLYLNGKLQGAIEKWDLTFDWDPAKVLLVLGASYVGHMDDLAVFDRPLTDVEVDRIYGLKNGIRELYP